jgi:uncharacterized protein
MAAETTSGGRRKQGARPRHVPQRTCVACREVDAKREYTRLVRTPERTVEVDPSGKANGRGAYLHRSRRCWSRALESGAIAKALKVELDTEDRERLWTYARTHFPPDDD